MKAETININWDLLNPAWLFGPIFDKELRVSSRRKRNYYLRSVYILLLCLFILFVSLVIFPMQSSNSTLFQTSRAAVTGKWITIVIIWFQFIVSQLLAMVMLSSSISDEIRTGTLNVLMTTPINSFQIVTGKLFSKLLQIFLLLAVSLPLLAIIRVFGGISWDYLLFSLIITIVTVIFAGSFSLFLSVFYRYSYRVIVYEFSLFAIFWGAIPMLLALSVNLGLYKQIPVHTIITSINPYWSLIAATRRMSPGSIFTPSHIFNCLILLCLSGIFLGISVWRVRSAALNQFSLRNKKGLKRVKGIEAAHYDECMGNIKQVTGSPIIWKEMYSGFFGEGWTSKFIYIVIALVVIASAFSTIGHNNSSRIASLQISSLRMVSSFIRIAIYFIMILRLAATSASSIAREKEGRTLSILLVSPIDNKDIIRGKVKAAILKNIPLFILYIIPTLIALLSINHDNILQNIFQVPLSVINMAASIFFVSSCGIYHGVRSKSSTSAIVNTILTYFVIVWIGFGLISFMFNLLFAIFYNPSRYSIHILWYNLIISFINTLIVGGLGLFYLRRAERNLRTRIF